MSGEEFTQPWTNSVLSSIAAVITKGDDWESLLYFMQQKGMTDYRLAFSFYGILNGFANLTRDFTDELFSQDRKYIANVYREFYGQLHGVSINIGSQFKYEANESIYDSNNSKELLKPTLSLYIQILLLPLHSLTTSRKWNKADLSFVPRQIMMFCPHSLTSESGQFTGL